MGPQLDSCGRLCKGCGTELGAWLQWGRNLIVAEGIERLIGQDIQRMLQWGRNLIVAEGATTAASFGTLVSFNGAAT